MIGFKCGGFWFVRVGAVVRLVVRAWVGQKTEVSLSFLHPAKSVAILRLIFLDALLSACRGTVGRVFCASRTGNGGASRWFDRV